MDRTKIKKSIPIILLVTVCLILGGVIIARNLEDTYVPTMADGDESTEMTDDTTVHPAETEVPPKTDPPETEPVVIASQGLEFTSLGNGTCYISGVGSCRDSFIILPSQSEYGEKVVGIGDYAFRGCKTLKCIELPEGLKFIGAYAFYGSELVNVLIPSTMEQIGDFAFANCKELENIDVDISNSLYGTIDGVLYSKDGSKLICYPAGKNEIEIDISAQVNEIKTMAFYNCNSIKMVNYEGSVSSYKRIQIGAGNESFESAVVSYISGGSQDTGNTNIYEK